MPVPKTDAPSLHENADGTVTAQYQPKLKGLHEMFIKCNGMHVQGSPFQFYVDNLKDGWLTAYGAGLLFGTAGDPAVFTVGAKEAGTGHSIVGHGGLSVSVDGPAKAEVKCHDNKDGTCAVTWIPPAPGEYKITVKFADKEIFGSPFRTRVSGENRKRALLSVGSTSEVSLSIKEPDVKGLSSSIKSPSGIEEPCFIRKLEEGKFGVSFTPREVGQHLVSVKKKGTLLPQAPFKISVSEKEVGNAGKVVASGPALQQAITQQFNEFTVDTKNAAKKKGTLLPQAPFKISVSEKEVGNAGKVVAAGPALQQVITQQFNEFTGDAKNAGFGGLSISVEGPSKSEIQCKENKDGICKLAYKPVEPGIYVLGIKFADHHIPSSPFTVKCQGAGVGIVKEQASKQLSQTTQVGKGDRCEIFLRCPNAAAMDMAAKIMDPEGNVEDIEIMELSEAQFLIRLVPSVLGLHTVSVLSKGQHIAGSPYQYTVGPFKEGGSHKVRAGGSGLVRGEVNIPASFNIYTREAGSGSLTVAIEGPSQAKVEYKEHKDGNGYIIYNVSRPGEYNIAIKFNDQHVPDSPFKLYVSPSTGEARKLSFAAFPAMGVQADKPVTFTVLTNGAKGHLDARYVAPSGAQDHCFMTPIDEGESYAVRFIPRELGNHYVQIMLDGTHMPDSPFRIRVGGKEETDPTAVTAGGGGLKSGETGHKCEFIINTCNAGEGTLQVSVDGPSKVTLDAYEVDVGYKVRYTPMAPGDYFMTVKFNGVHVPGSPFKVVISGKQLGGSGYNESSTVNINATSKSGKAEVHAPKYTGDAGKVECKGMGLKRGNLGRASNFVIDCSKAGQDLLTVAAMTPKGPCEEVYLKHTGRGNYNVNYVVKERGKAFLFVKYGETHVPGSPFQLEVV